MDCPKWLAFAVNVIDGVNQIIQTQIGQRIVSFAYYIHSEWVISRKQWNNLISAKDGFIVIFAQTDFLLWIQIYRLNEEEQKNK